MIGNLGILNVGAGDIKITFDHKDPAELIRARRMVTDMLRQGYALLIKLPDGTHTRAKGFDETTGEYIIADFDPSIREKTNEQETETVDFDDANEGQAPRPRGRLRGTKRVAASTSEAIAVPRTSGG